MLIVDSSSTTKRKLRFSLAVGVALPILTMLPAYPARAQIDDRKPTIHTPAEASARRSELIQFIWGVAGWPSGGQPSKVVLNVGPPFPGLSSIARVDRIEASMESGQSRTMFHYIPARPNHRLIVFHHGHACRYGDPQHPDDPNGQKDVWNDGLQEYDDNHGMEKALQALLAAGYSVLTVTMPGTDPNNCLLGSQGLSEHDYMRTVHVSQGSQLKFFLEPVAVALNYLSSASVRDHYPEYAEFDMLGLSGGGWTTTVYAALDPRITLSVPVAGSLPLFLRANTDDFEQTLPDFYAKAGYADLYVLGGFGRDRRQVQVLNRNDGCCFNTGSVKVGLNYDKETQAYAAAVSQTLASLGPGGFTLHVEDVPANSNGKLHLISNDVRENWILHSLDGSHGQVLGSYRVLFYNRKDGSGQVSQETANHALATEWFMKPGTFAQWTNMTGLGDGSIFAYNAASRSGAVAHRGADNSIITDWTINPGGLAAWTHVVGLGDGHVLAYNADQGAAVVARRAQDNSMVNEWEIKPGGMGHFTDVASFNDGTVFFYDRNSHAGRVAHRAEDNSLVTDWAYKPGDLRPWTSIASLGGEYLLFYDKLSGNATVSQRASDGSMHDVWHGKLEPGWALVSPIGNGSVFLYDAEQERGKIMHRAPDNSLAADWSSSQKLGAWSNIVPF